MQSCDQKRQAAVPQKCQTGPPSKEDETDMTESRSSSFSTSKVAESRVSTDAFVVDEKDSLLATLPARLAFVCALARSTYYAVVFFETLASGFTTVSFFSFMLVMLLARLFPRSNDRCCVSGADAGIRGQGMLLAFCSCPIAPDPGFEPSVFVRGFAEKCLWNWNMNSC